MAGPRADCVLAVFSFGALGADVEVVMGATLATGKAVVVTAASGALVLPGAAPAGVTPSIGELDIGAVSTTAGPAEDVEESAMSLSAN
jgi:hypothetical protein